jgi:hypothetical protein
MVLPIFIKINVFFLSSQVFFNIFEYFVNLLDFLLLHSITCGSNDHINSVLC